MIFKPFQFLYQTFKGTDQRLFDTFERIHLYLQELFDETGNITLSVIDSGVGLILKDFYQDIPGLSLTIKKSGTWLISASLECHHVFNDGKIEFRIICNGKPSLIAGILGDNAGEITATISKSWVYKTSMRIGDEVRISVQARIALDSSAGSVINSGDLAAVWMNSNV